jgi:hypothetical protein
MFGVRPEDMAPRPSRFARPRFPVPLRAGIRERGEDALPDPEEQVVLVAHVVIQRHRLDAELSTDPPHRDRVEPFVVHDQQRRVDDPITR